MFNLNPSIQGIQIVKYSNHGTCETLEKANAAIAAARSATPAAARIRYASSIRSVRTGKNVLYYWSWS